MATGASTCDLAVILIDARHGVMTQTRRHSYIASLLGLKHVVVAINKMDLVDFSEEVFARIKADYNTFAKSLGLSDVYFVPMSALEGDNVVNRSEHTPWYTGETLMGILETVQIVGDKNFTDFRFPVQYVNRPHLNFRGFCGTIASGEVKPGDRVKVLPSGKSSAVKEIVTYDGNLDLGFAGQAVTLTLTDEIDVSRGDMIVHESAGVVQSNHFKAHLVWMSEAELQPGRQYLLKFASKLTPGEVTSIQHRIDVNTQELTQVSSLGLNDIAQVEVVLQQQVVMDPYQKNKGTGAFIVIDRLTNITVGAGMVDEVLSHTTETAAGTYSEFELELNALIRKHFPHWGAADISK